MNNYNLNQFLKTKVMLSTFFIVSCLFICEKALAVVWGWQNCHVTYRAHHPYNKTAPNKININFKFFEYEVPNGVDNTFLEYFEVFYSLDDGIIYFPLIAASTENQKFKSWAWIELRNKSDNTKIEFSFVPFDSKKLQKLLWENKTTPKLFVKNSRSRFNNETWLWMDWYLSEERKNVTHIRIRAKCHTPGMMHNEDIDWVYDVRRKKN